jgi:hypothetical protein
MSSNDNTRRNINGVRDRLAVRIVGLIGAEAEGSIAIGALVLIVLVAVLFFR